MSIILKYLEEEEFRLKDMVQARDKNYWQGCLYEIRKIIRRVRELEQKKDEGIPRVDLAMIDQEQRLRDGGWT